MAQKPTFNEALRFWIQLGFISFGGPAGQIAIMHDYLVVKKQWITERRFLHALNFCMLLPGPEAQQLATYMGWLLHGTWGGLAAGLLFILPSLFILLGLSILYVSFGNIPWIYALFHGLKPAIVAIVVLALIKIGKRSLLSPLHWVIALMSFLGITFFHISFPILLVGASLVAIMGIRFFPSILTSGNEATTSEKELKDDLSNVNQHSVSQTYGLPFSRIGLSIISGLILWSIPLFLFYVASDDFIFWKKVTLFFTQSAWITFGGAYAVLPYVAEVSVEKFNWLTNLQMMDGLALGESTPGPLIMVLAFVGFMAGYHHFGHSLVMGSLGLLTTTFYTFLPSFLFIFVGAPIIERTQNNQHIKNGMSFVTSAVVGVMMNLILYLGKAIVLKGQWSFSNIQYPTAAWILISIFSLYRFKIGIIPWIGLSALYGLVMYGLIR